MVILFFPMKKFLQSKIPKKKTRVTGGARGTGISKTHFKYVLKS